MPSEHPSRQVDEDSKAYPTAPREQHPKYGTCFAKALYERIAEREGHAEPLASCHLIPT